MSITSINEIQVCPLQSFIPMTDLQSDYGLIKIFFSLISWNREKSYRQLSGHIHLTNDYIEKSSKKFIKIFIKKMQDLFDADREIWKNPLSRTLISILSMEIKTVDLASSETLENQIESILVSRLHSIIRIYEMRMLDLTFRPSLDELRLIGVDYQAYINKKISHDCTDFAFYKLWEPCLMPWILGEDMTKPPFKSADCIYLSGKLKKWGYEAVYEPCIGDLIIYVDQSRRVKHFGIFESSTRIISKWGDLPIFSHPIYSVPDEYGIYYKIFRKSRGNGLELKINEEIEQLEPPSSFPSCYPSVFDIKTFEELKEKIKYLTNAYEDKAKERPPYGKSYFKKVENLFEQNLGCLLYNPNEGIPSLKIKEIANRIWDSVSPLE